ncbi:hypothetical protein, partial [Segatella copri]|uniref:hypothetical protein n=1 Tax=Segatella copri TaxID=165179 RepID=UPI001C0315CC
EIEFLNTKGVLLQRHFVILHLLVEFAAVEDSAAKLTKSFEKILIEVIILLGCPVLCSSF